MNDRRNLLKISLVFLVLNIFLIGLAVFSFLDSGRNLSEISDRQGEESVLGDNSSVPKFNPNYIMSDSTFSSTRAFPSEWHVQNYLDQVNSPLKDYTENGQKASTIIFKASRGETSSKWNIRPQINPGVIIAYLEKENSLISRQNYDIYGDPEGRMRTAMGYGCPDSAVCESEYFGFSNQVNWAAYQLQYNFQLSQSSTPDNYKVNKTITTLDEYNVFLSNPATAANYRYTPHVYWGNYNLWKIITANGWGVSNRTWSYKDIDAVNLQGKDGPIDVRNLPKISKEEINPILKKNYNLGESGEEIKKLQIFLRQEGYYMTREINGMYGVITKKAHYSYRKDFAVLGDFKTVPRDTCVSLINRNWVMGTQSNEIKTLQQCLRELGLFDWSSNTGYFGPVTLDALEAARKGLNNDSAQTETGCDGLKNQNWNFGETSERVRKLQGCMRAEGVFNWPYGDTGYFGPVTQEALAKWKGQQVSTDNCDELKNKNWTFGEKSENIRKLQLCMQDKGFFKWKYGATGYFGPVTQEALTKWKSEGNETSSSGTCEQLKKNNYKIGDRGENIKKLQGCMRAEGVFNWPYGDTGYFGPVTQEALAKWKGQQVNGDFSCSSLKQQVWVMEERSERVRQLQGCMRAEGVFNWPYGDTGYFGNATMP